jgi:hypothetical protein
VEALLLSMRLAPSSGSRTCHANPSPVKARRSLLPARVPGSSRLLVSSPLSLPLQSDSSSYLGALPCRPHLGSPSRVMQHSPVRSRPSLSPACSRPLACPWRATHDSGGHSPVLGSLGSLYASGFHSSRCFYLTPYRAYLQFSHHAAPGHGRLTRPGLQLDSIPVHSPAMPYLDQQPVVLFPTVLSPLCKQTSSETPAASARWRRDVPSGPCHGRRYPLRPVSSVPAGAIWRPGGRHDADHRVIPSSCVEYGSQSVLPSKPSMPSSWQGGQGYTPPELQTTPSFI